MVFHKGEITHWGRVTHICVGKLIIIGSDNGWSPDRRQAIIWTNARLLSVGPVRTYFNENLIKIQQFSLKEMQVKMSSAKWRPSGLGLNVINMICRDRKGKLIQFVWLWFRCDETFPVPVKWFNCINSFTPGTLQWRHNEHDGVSNHQPYDCLLNLYSGADQRKHRSSASLAFVRGIHRGPVNSPHKWPVTRKMFPFDDVIMNSYVEWLTLESGNRLCQFIIWTNKKHRKFQFVTWVYHD